MQEVTKVELNKNLLTDIIYRAIIYPLPIKIVITRKGGLTMQNNTTINNKIMKLTIKGTSLPKSYR